MSKGGRHIYRVTDHPRHRRALSIKLYLFYFLMNNTLRKPKIITKLFAAKMSRLDCRRKVEETKRKFIGNCFDFPF